MGRTVSSAMDCKLGCTIGCRLINMLAHEACFDLSQIEFPCDTYNSLMEHIETWFFSASNDRSSRRGYQKWKIEI